LAERGARENMTPTPHFCSWWKIERDWGIWKWTARPWRVWAI